MDTRQENPTNSVKALRRRSEDKLVAGVAGGLGDYTGLDPVIFRIGFIFLTMLGGAGIALYGLAWLLIPTETEERSRAEIALRSWWKTSSWVGIAAIAIGAAILVGSLGFWEPGLMWAVALIAVGFVLLRDDDRGPERPGPVAESDRTATTTDPPPPPAASDVEAAGTDVAGRADMTARPDAAPAVDAPPTVPAPAVAPAKPRRERSSLGWFTIAAVLVAVGVAAVLENWDVMTLDVGQFFALALSVLGAGLLVGAWWGRARLLIVLGVLLVPLVLASSLVDMPLRGRVGDSFLVPQTASDVADGFEVLAGHLTLGLDEIRTDEDLHVDASVAMGSLDVVVPRGVRVIVNGTMNAGRLDFFGRVDSGFDVRKSIVEGDPDSERTITLDIEAGIGNVDVYWGGPYPNTKGGAD